MLSLASWPAFAATANDPLLQAFHDRLTNVRAWADKNDRSPLDFRVVAAPARADSRTVRTLDGKLRLTVNDATLRVAAPVLWRSLPLVVYRGDVSSLRSWRLQNPGVDINAQAIQIAKDAGVACRWEYQSAGTVQRTCHLELRDLLGALITALRLSPCDKAQAPGSCAEVEGRPWAVGHTPGRMEAQQRQERLVKSLETLLQEVVRDKIEVVDRNGKRLDNYKVSLSPSSHLERELLVLESVHASQEVKSDGQVAAQDTLGQLPLLQIFGASLLVDAQTQIAMEQRAREALTAQQSNNNAIESLRQRPQDLGAIALDSGKSSKACTVGRPPRADADVTAEYGRLGVPMSPGYRKWRTTGGGDYAEVLDSAETLYAALQRQQCAVAIGSGAELTVLVGAMQRDGLAFSVMPDLLAPEAGVDLYARAKGYANGTDLRLAIAMGNLTPVDLERYRAGGIGSQSIYDEISKRKQASGYLGSHGDLIDFLKDEQAAKAANITVLEAYSRRVAVLRAQEQAGQRARVAAQPYRITLTCSVGNTITILQVCLSSHGANASLTLRDGPTSRQYEGGDIYRLGRDTPDGFVFDSSPDVALRVRNIAADALLRLKVVDLRTGNTIYEDTAPPFRSLAFSR
ncbi:hypothetical protein ACXIUT_23225 [Achromobacter denitrificans]